jgi:hypothetical protein
MVNKETVISKLYNSLSLLDSLAKLSLKRKNKCILYSGEKELLAISRKNIQSPFSEIIKKVFEKPSSLIDEDEFLEDRLLCNLLREIVRNATIVRLNHLGFCYRVQSVIQERKNFVSITIKSQFYPYEMTSCDNSLWLFAGNITQWCDHMLEFLPIENDFGNKEVDYWLPHLHIDIDTGFYYEKIIKVSNSILKGLRSVNAMRENGFVTKIRIWLGVISGINIHLDLGTSINNTRYMRKVMLKRI